MPSAPSLLVLPGGALPWLSGLGLLLGGLGVALLRARSSARRFERERDQLALRLRDATALRNTFVAAMSHELRTPMNAILLYCELLIQETEEQGLEALTEDLRRVQHAGNYLLTLIQSLLDLSRLGTPTVGLASGFVDVDTLFADVADTLRPLAERKGNRLVTVLEAPGLDLLADAMKLKQVLVVLGSHACRNAEGGTITLRAGRAGGGVRFDVEDPGEGLSQEQLDRIFRPLDPAAEAAGWDLGPAGLTLFLSACFALRMGGWIRGSCAPGRGTCIQFWLPLGPPASREAPAQ